MFFPQVENLTTPLISYVGSGVPQEVLDMPVDPNEPTYCVCQQVSNYICEGFYICFGVTSLGRYLTLCFILHFHSLNFSIAGFLRRDDWLRQPGLSYRVVPLRLHGPDPQAEGQVVLPQVSAHVQEEGQVVHPTPLRIVIMLPKEEIRKC